MAHLNVAATEKGSAVSVAGHRTEVHALSLANKDMP